MNKYAMDAKKIHTGKKRIHAFFHCSKLLFFWIFVFMLLSLSTVALKKKPEPLCGSSPNIINISSLLEFLFPCHFAFVWFV